MIAAHRALALLAVLVGYLPACAPVEAASAPDERVQHLLEMSIAYGQSHFDSAANLVVDAAGAPDIPEYSLPYATALLERGVSTSRAKAILSAVLATQDRTAGSPTRGHFAWRVDSSRCAPQASWHVAPLLARILSRHAGRLGDEQTQELRAAMELALAALGRGRAAAKSDEDLMSHAARAQLGAALGDDGYAIRAAAAVANWLATVAKSGRVWAPTATDDALRILALQRIWEAAAAGDREAPTEGLRLCYLDLAQRVHPSASLLAGASTSARPEEYLEGLGTASYLAYKDFALAMPRRVTPFATVIALTEYRPPEDVIAAALSEEPRVVVTTSASAAPDVPHQTYTYVNPAFSLGTMTGWVMPDSLPIFAAFGRATDRPAAYFRAHGCPAHISSLQYENLAICSFNFDRVGLGKRLQAWIRGCLGTVDQVEEVWALNGEWNGEPMALGTRDTVAVKRNGAYLAVTILECGAADDLDARRKPGELRWEGIGEHARLELTIYARHEDYPVRRYLDDLRAGVVVQIWDGDQFPSTDALLAWLRGARIAHRYSRTLAKTAQARDTRPVLDRNKPQPRRKYTTRTQRVHTIEYQYDRRRDGNLFTLVEDVRSEKVLRRALNDQPLDGGLWWQSPALSWAPGQTAAEALGPAPAAGE